MHPRTLRRVVLVGALALLPVLADVPSTVADTYGDPVVVSPSPDSSVASGFRGPYEVDFSAAAPGTYSMEIYCNDANDYDVAVSYVYDGSNPHFSTTLDPIAGPEHCEFDVPSDTDAGQVSAYFDVEGDPVELGSATASPSTFYPEVTDGYRDSTSVDYNLSQTATVSVDVVNSTGTVIRQTRVPGDIGENSWKWDGRDVAGNLVPVGTYKVELTAVDEWSNHAAATVPVTVATRTDTKTTTLLRYGSQYSGFTHSSRCGADLRGRTLALRCAGGSDATARFVFSVPLEAGKISVRRQGYRLPGDDPRHGVVLTKRSRPTPRTVEVDVAVTRRRAFAVTAVELRFQTSRTF